MDRRKFIEVSAQSTLGVGLSMGIQGCATGHTRTVFGACYHDCPDRCSWQTTTAGGEIKDFQASTNNPFTAGTLCNKMVNFPNDVTFHPDRILTPLKRRGKKGEGEFQAISWEKALAEISSQLTSIISQKGGEAVLPYSYGGNQGLVQGKSIPNRFFAHIGASRLERTICGSAAVAGVLATNGQTTGVLPEDIIHSRYIVLWGTNTKLTNQHLWPLVLNARSKGAKLVVIDPFQSQTALEADWHIQPLPGTDTALALGLMHVILRENLQDQDYVSRYTSGIQELTEHVQRYTPTYVAELTGLEEETIVSLAREYARSSPSLIRVLIGMEHQANGGSAFRAIAMLPALTGAWRQLGGGLMHMTYELFGQALNWEKINLPKPLANPSTRRINMIQLGKALTDPSLDPPLEALFVFNSNPVVTTPNQNLIIKGLERADLLTVVLEHFVTDTARYADYVFPATSVLESWDVLTSWGTPYLHINQPAIKPVGEAKPNTEFFRLLAREMGFTESYLYEADIDIVKGVLDSDHDWMQGITFASLQKTGWAKLRIPEPWMPHREGNFHTKFGKCMLYNPEMDPPLPRYQPIEYSEEEVSSYPFHLLTIKSPKNFLNSSHANVDYLLKKEGSPILDMNEEDAADKGIKDGDQVRAFNQRGEVLLIARIRRKVRKGVVCMPQGFWPSLVAGGSSANALTDDRLTDMGRGGAIQEARVDVVKI